MKSACVVGGGVLLLLGVMVVAAMAAGGAVGPFARPEEAAHAAGQGTAAAQLHAAVSTADRQACLDENTLRRIIRQELAAQTATMGVAPDATAPTFAGGSPSAPDNHRRLERVNQQVDAYIRAGAISQVEMAVLQDEIAKLDKASQREMLGKIVRAMNSGALAGNL